jgi:hypothetical protein
VRRWVAKVDLEVHKGAIFFEGEEIGDVEACVGEKVELALQVEVKKTFCRRVRGDDVGVEASVFREFLVLLPMFVAATGRTGKRNRKPRFGRTFHFGMKDGISKEFGAESGKFLAVIFVEGEIEPDAVDADLDAFVGIIAEIHFDGEDAGSIRRLLREG